MNFPAASQELIEHGRPLLVEKFEDRSHCSIVLFFKTSNIYLYLSLYSIYIYTHPILYPNNISYDVYIYIYTYHLYKLYIRL